MCWSKRLRFLPAQKISDADRKRYEEKKETGDISELFTKVRSMLFSKRNYANRVRICIEFIYK